MTDLLKKAEKKPRPKLRLDAASRALLARFVRDWVWPRRWQLAWTLFLTTCLAAVTGGYPGVIKKSFDLLMGGKPGALPYVLVAIVGITLARATLLFLQAVATSRFVLRMTSDMQKMAFRHLINADFARLSRETPGRLMSRLTNDIGFIQSALTATLNSIFRDTFSVIALVIAMLYLDWAMTLIVLGVYPLAAIPVASISHRLRRVAKQTQSGLGDMTSLLTEKLSGARLIKSFQLENYAADRLDSMFEQIYSLRMKSVRTRARMDPILEVLGGVAIAGVVGFAYLRISQGISSVGDFMGFVTALMMAAQPIKSLGNLTGRLQEGLAAAESFYGLIDELPSITDKPGAKTLAISKGEIAFRNVSFAYDKTSEERAVHGFTLDVPGGSTIALVGRSGAGKSTIINLVPRLFDATEGQILIDGQDVMDVTLKSLRDQIAIVSQDITLFDDTIEANIRLGRLGASEADIIEAAKAAAAHDFIMTLPDGYKTIIGDRGSRLSGGQRQRLALARAILKNAPILLLDEATSALDNESEQLVQEALAKFTRSRTTLVIAHRLSTVQNADVICVMDGGRIVERGRHSELIARNGSYARLNRSASGPQAMIAN
ncbi:MULTISPECIES: ABC transporter ATP-binding protein [unclassified Hyphomicrobium]|uniref:ABC transporter ATP-binding protein n=1 Tax=unclassified Hyphomicrobium TaxID=2619925 RepID=UPI000213DFD9|nr:MULTISPECIES: ABC transporter transmembrane domain-containing protein [unclassified Hyphomicrobium]CCB67033.1 Lipid A export ATP-binding/permease protein MsbA [Hyphomicrobium sp. MC1]